MTEDPPTPAEIERRRAAVRQAVASVVEGGHIELEMLALLERAVLGKLTEEEIIDRLRQAYDARRG